ncbi:unnamed protein product [Lactuca saligna]|uniref:Uncharacterized protein n=1 Tax=Lactuca saligna TaxID=75948 RepID=A0AA35YME2_LACSI|nr:unnamed protein product [Lactuca saligna]
MSSDHQDTRGFQPPTTIDELHRQPPSSITGNNLLNLPTPRLLHTPSPMSLEVETKTPESPISASLGSPIFTTPSTSFDGAAPATTTTTTVNTHNPLRQTSTDTNSSANQDPPSIATTPSKVPEPPTRNILLRHSHFDPIKTDSQEHQKNKTPPPPPRVSTTPKSRTSPPVSPTRNQIPESKVMVERGRNGCFSFQE